MPHLKSRRSGVDLRTVVDPKSAIGEKHYRQMYIALERIKSYQKPETLRRRSQRDWGLDNASEAIEMAYENVLDEARIGLKGVRRPSLLTTRERQT